MSYILDALRKADAERERDPARGIHAQPAAVPLPPARIAPRWAWASAGIAAAAVAAVAWQRATAPAADVPPLPVTPPMVRASAPAAPATLVPVAATVEPPAPIVIIKAAPPQRHAAKVAVAAASAPSAAAGAHAPPVVAATAAAPVAVGATPAAAPERIYAVSELPSDVQQQLPKLAISGGVSSENRAQRMLIVGGQVMFEGAQLAPGVVLEQVRAKSAVLRFRGYRYSVAY